MSKEKELYEFVKQNFRISKIPLCNENTKQVFHTLYKHILAAQQSWTMSFHKIQQSPLEQKDGPDFTKGPAFSLIPHEIRQSIEHCKKYERTYQFKIGSDHVRLILVHPIIQNVQETPSVQSFFSQVLYKTYLWLHVANVYAPKRCSERMNLYMYFSNHQKILAKTLREPLDTVHVNTAFTTSCAPSTDIHLYRKEEWFKVLIHETFHNLGLDFSLLDNREGNRRILEMFPIEKDVRFFESYCETWANFLHTLFFTFFSTQDKHNWDLISKKMEQRMKYEQIFSTFQCVKVLQHYGLTYYDLVQTQCPLAERARRQYREKTYILAYYVIKTILVAYPNEFIEWCRTHNGSAKTQILRFTATQQNIVAFTNLVRTLYKQKDVLQLLENMEQWFRESFVENEFARQTLRMTM